MIRELTRAATLRLVSRLPTFAYPDSNSQNKRYVSRRNKKQ